MARFTISTTDPTLPGNLIAAFAKQMEPGEVYLWGEKEAKRIEAKIKRKWAQGKDAPGGGMAKLAKRTLHSKPIVSYKGDFIQRARSGWGKTPMNRTGQLMEQVRGVGAKDGFRIMSTDLQGWKVLMMQGGWRQIQAAMKSEKASSHKLPGTKINITPAMRRKLASMRIYLGENERTLFRPARIPVAMSRNMVKESVRSFMKHLTQPLRSRDLQPD